MRRSSTSRLMLAAAFLLLCLHEAGAQEFIPLWPAGQMPNSKGLQLADDIRNERIYQVGTPGMQASKAVTGCATLWEEGRLRWQTAH